MNIFIKKLHPDAIIPAYQTAGSSGVDFHTIEDVTLLPKETKLIRTGIQMSFPIDTELQIRPRSGLSLKTNLRVANSPGSVDADFAFAENPEIKVIMQNTGEEEFYIKKGDRIAQGVICPIIRGNLIESEEVYDIKSTRKGGFGSTG